MNNNAVTFTITLDDDDLVYLDFEIHDNSYIFSPVPKLRECLANSFSIIQSTKLELVNFFNLNEASLIAASTEDSVRYNLFSAKESLIGDVSEYYSYIDPDDTFNIVQADILSKLEKLNKHQAYCIYQMCFAYWENDKEDQTEEVLKRIFQINE